MIYREANDDDHELIVKQIRSNYIQNILLLTPVIPVGSTGIGWGRQRAPFCGGNGTSRRR